MGFNTLPCMHSDLPPLHYHTKTLLCMLYDENIYVRKHLVSNARGIQSLYHHCQPLIWQQLSSQQYQTYFQQKVATYITNTSYIAIATTCSAWQHTEVKSAIDILLKFSCITSFPSYCSVLHTHYITVQLVQVEFQLHECI